MSRKEGGFAMTDTNESVKALEARVTALENLVTAAHGKADCYSACKIDPHMRGMGAPN